MNDAIRTETWPATPEPRSPASRVAPPADPDIFAGQRPGPAAPSAGFEPAHTAPEADALSPELRGRGPESLAVRIHDAVGTAALHPASRMERVTPRWTAGDRIRCPRDRRG